MASYFDLPKQEGAANTASIDALPEDTRKQLGKMSLLSPQVSRILDDMGDDKSDSDSEEGSLSEEADVTQLHKEKKVSQKPEEKKKSAYTSPLSSAVNSSKIASEAGPDYVKKSSAHSSTAKSKKPKQPHMARFHSLRSMLFAANLEDKMNSATKEDCMREEAATNKWKHQHEDRQMHRPKTPEKDAKDKDGMGSRLKMRLRRLTSKDVPTMGQIQEDKVSDFSDHGSTASSDAEDERDGFSQKHRDTDEESINHSDVEDLVRWVSRRDPPSDGEARKSKGLKDLEDTGGHESLGESDVDDLVRWASRRSENKKNTQIGYSDASTESDSELVAHSSEDEDEEDLMRWISRRDGAKAGPVRRNLQAGDVDWEVEKHYDSDVPELGRWFKRNDETSGESGASTPVRNLQVPTEEPERGRPRSRSGSPAMEEKKHLSNDDIDELVRWVSRKESKPQAAVEEAARKLALKQGEEQKEHIGMKIDKGSLSHSDVQDLLDHVGSPDAEQPPTIAKVSEPESGDLRTLRADQAAVKETQQKEEEKKEKLGTSVDERSLSRSDVPDLISHVKNLDVNSDQRPGTTDEKDAVTFTAQDHFRQSRGESGEIDDHDFTLAREKEDEAKKKEQLGMTQDRTGSLQPDEVDELVKWVSRKNM